MTVLSLDLQPDSNALVQHVQALRTQQIQVVSANAVPDLSAEANNGSYTAILLHDGTDEAVNVVTEVRKVTGTPLIVMRNRSDADGSIKLFEAGADDVITETLDPNELAARVRSMARRCMPGEKQKLVVGDLELSPKDFTVFRGGKRVMLTNREFDLLQYLMEHRDRVLTRTELADRVWGDEVEWTSNVIDVSIGRLRNKIHLPEHPTLIHTVTGRGYMLSDAPPAATAAS